MPAGRRPPCVFIVACEPSGDALGGSLIAALRERSERGVRICGVGGERMAAQGVESLFPMADLAVMGFGGVIPRLIPILRRQRELAATIVAERPDVVVTIDSSSFNKGLARLLARAGVAARRVHYVAPMVWAWRPGRARSMSRRFDHLLTLFAFEPALFEATGLPSTWVGHPAVEAPPADGAAFRRQHGISPEARVLCLLPGSRSAEVAALLPRFLSSAGLLRAMSPELELVIPTVATIAAEVRSIAARADVPVRIVEGESEKRAAFAASEVALAASGTVTLELALASVPMVVAYRPDPLSGWLAARLIRIPHVALVNILLGRKVVPELLRGACEPDRLAAALRPLLTDPIVRAAQLDAFVALRPMLDRGGLPPSRRAADVVLALASDGMEAQIPRGSERRNE